MLFTWMIATQMWIEGDPKADPFRMAEEEMGKILTFTPPEKKQDVRPSDKSLVA